MPKSFSVLIGISLCLYCGQIAGFAWDYPGHRAINEIALKSLPANFPAFVKTPAAMERIAFLAGEPDRWRNTQDHTLRHFNEPDHFLDLEYLAGFGLRPDTMSPFRYEFVSQLAAARARNPNIPPIADPESDANHTRAFFGFLPWTINEYYLKLKSEFSYLKAFEQNGGTAEEIHNAQENIIYTMGVMGHFVGDAAQPLHVTKFHNGWDGPNPRGYTTRRTFHAWIDGGYFEKVGIGLPELLAKTPPARVIEGANARNEGIFQNAMAFIVAQNAQVEPLYQLEKEGKLSGDGTVGLEGKKFLQGQLLKAGEMLGDIWLTAWQTAAEDGYLKAQMVKRRLATEGAPATK